MMDNLKDLMTGVGILVTVAVFLGFIILLIVKIYNLIADHRDIKRCEYIIAHRFDDPPLAKCYCIDCQYCYGEPTRSGSGVYCSLFNSGIVIQDNSFCYRAEPKGRVRND